jgi:hypothetical protein
LHHNHSDEKAQTFLDGTLPASTFLKEWLTGHNNATGEAQHDVLFWANPY